MDAMNFYKFGKLWKRFVEDHPKFPNFINKVKQRGLEPGDIVALTITKKDGEVIKSNIRLTNNDLESFNEIKNFNK